MDPDLTLALELADEADSISLPSFRAADLVVEWKPDLTPVTETDRAVESALRERIAARRPDDSVVGEEFGDAGGDTADRRWVIDPIDGTKNFVRGIPIWATLIALERDDELGVAVVSAPAMARRWWAVRGGGAFADGQAIEVSKVSRPDKGLLCYGGLTAWRKHGRVDDLLQLAGGFERSRGFGDFWMHMLVAQGSAEAAVELEVSLWDLAAVKVIVDEAGGRFTDVTGRATASGGSALSTNGLVHDFALGVLGGRPGGVTGSKVTLAP